MASAQPIANDASVPNTGLIRLLRQADSELGHLRERAQHVVALEDPDASGFCARQMKTLCGILDYGRGRIQRRLATLDGPGGAAEGSPDSGRPGDIADPAAFMAEYRACCRLLCQALNEALGVSNAPTGAMLSDFVLRLEKQLWLMDPPKNTLGPDPYRIVSLFLTC
jgi:hypothetical protein